MEAGEVFRWIDFPWPRDGDIKPRWFFPPSFEEQKDILEFIKTETNSLNNLITKYQKQIDLMQEYRTSLINQAVTGKIDVRGAVNKNKVVNYERKIEK